MGLRKKKSIAPSDSDGTSKKKKKKNVKEIDGQMWLLDAAGNPLKKIRRKGGATTPDRASLSPKRGGSSLSPKRGAGKAKKKKKDVAEIDGQLFLLDSTTGKPLKKIRRKNDDQQGTRRRLTRRRSAGHALEAAAKGSRGRGTEKQERKLRRTRSLGANVEENDRSQSGERQEYIDSKGRKVVIEEDGNKIVFDKNGKRLRKKKKQEDPATPTGRGSMNGKDFLNTLKPSRFPSTNTYSENFFDKLWDDNASRGPLPTSRTRGDNNGEENHENVPSSTAGENIRANGDDDDTHGDTTNNSSSLTAKISEYGKENRELKLKVLNAEEEIQDLTDLHKKEKAKNVKTMTEMMQLKADFHEMSGEMRVYRLEIKELKELVDSKEKQIVDLKQKALEMAAPTSDAGNRSRSPSLRDQFDDGEDRVMARNNQGAPTCESCDATRREVEDLFAENRALQRKVEFEKGIAQTEIKKREEKLVLLSNDMADLKRDMEKFIRDGGGNEEAIKPLMVRLMNEKKEIEAKYEQEQLASKTRINEMQEQMDSLEEENAKLKKQLGKANSPAAHTHANHGASIRRIQYHKPVKLPENEAVNEVDDDDDGSIDLDYANGATLDDRIQGFGSTPAINFDNEASFSQGLWNKFRGTGR